MPLDCRKRDFFITGDRGCWLLWVLQQILFHFSSITYRLCLTNKKTWIIHPINYINIYYRFFHIRGGGGWNSAQLTGFFPSRSHNTDRCWEICLSSVEYLAFHRASPQFFYSIWHHILFLCNQDSFERSPFVLKWKSKFNNTLFRYLI